MNFFSDLMKLMKGCTEHGDNIGKDSVNGLVVSTIFATDLEIYETAIVDQKSAYPVERYKTRDAALAGHEKWRLAAETLTEVVDLGFADLIGPTKVTLIRASDSFVFVPPK